MLCYLQLQYYISGVFGLVCKLYSLKNQKFGLGGQSGKRRQLCLKTRTNNSGCTCWATRAVRAPRH